MACYYFDGLPDEFQGFLLHFNLERTHPFIVEFFDVRGNMWDDFTFEQLKDHYEDWLGKRTVDSWNKDRR
jgi:hypothetical protein